MKAEESISSIIFRTHFTTHLLYNILRSLLTTYSEIQEGFPLQHIVEFIIQQTGGNALGETKDNHVQLGLLLTSVIGKGKAGASLQEIMNLLQQELPKITNRPSN